MAHREFGLAEALATNAARDAVLDEHDLAPQERASAIAAFADVTHWDSHGAKSEWVRARGRARNWRARAR